VETSRKHTEDDGEEEMDMGYSDGEQKETEDVDGEPMDDLDGEPLDGEDLDGEPFDDDIDGVPVAI